MAEVRDDLLAVVSGIQRLLAPRADTPAAQSVCYFVGAEEGAVTFSERDLGFVYVLGIPDPLWPNAIDKKHAVYTRRRCASRKLVACIAWVK